MPIKVNDQLLLAPDVQERVDRLKEICRYDLFTFAKVVLGYSLLEERIHAPICSFLTDSFIDAVIIPQLQNERKKIPPIKHDHSLRRRKKLLLLPRNSFKTVLVSKALPLFILKECPNWSIMLDSEVKEHTIDNLSEIKKIIENNYLFRVLYGDWVGKKWDETKILISKRYRADSNPSIMVTGANVSTTGYHPDVLVADDLHSPENTSSGDMIQGVIDHWRELYRQLKPGGYMFIIGTTYTMTDLYAHIKENFKDEYDIYQHSVYNDDGSLWFPERLDETYLESQKGHTQRELAMFNAHYLLNPTPIGETKIDVTKFNHYKDLDVGKLNLFLLVDPAYSVKKQACRTAIVITGMDCDKNSFLVDYAVGRWTPDEGVARVVEMACKWNPRLFPLKVIGIETESGGEAFAAHCREKLAEADIICQYAPLKTKGSSKDSRIMKADGLQICVNEGHFYLNPNMVEFIQEANCFPVGTTMDLVDAVAYHFYIAYPPEKQIERVIHDDYYRIREFAEHQMYPNNKPQYHNVFGRREWQ